jgi:NTE family protein
MAYHAGALKALDEAGVDVGGFEVLVGTSAGSVMASYLAAGWTPQDFYDYGHGTHPKSNRESADEMARIFTPLWGHPVERVRRSIGSMFALASSRGHWRRLGRGSVPVSALRRMFPAGLYSTDETRIRLVEDLPSKWPARTLLICTTDLYTGRRVAFGAPGAPEAALPDAVLASTAIPGVFPPVRIGDRNYVDGGAVTATSVDLAAQAGCDVIVCIAPLGYHNTGALVLRDPKIWAPVLTRSFFARTLRDEVRAARAQGSEVVVIRPGIDDLRTLGTNAMRSFDRGEMIDLVRSRVAHFLRSSKGRALVDRLEQAA